MAEGFIAKNDSFISSTVYWKIEVNSHSLPLYYNCQTGPIGVWSNGRNCCYYLPNQDIQDEETAL